MLGMAYIRVLEVATFYTMFLLKPVGTRAHIQVCGTTPCMLRGAEDLREVCQHKINHEPFETNPDGTMSWEEVECLGACVNAPMVMIGKDTYEDLTVERFEEIVDAFAAGKGNTVKPGTQIDRIFSAPEGGPVTLLNGSASEARHRVRPAAAHPAARAGADERRPPARRRRRGGTGDQGTVAARRRFRRQRPKPTGRSSTSGQGTARRTRRCVPTQRARNRPRARPMAARLPGKATRSPAGDGAGAAGTAPQAPGTGATPARQLRT